MRLWWMVGVLGLVGCVSEPAKESMKESMKETPIRVEVWHDTVCPWCRIGLHNLNVALEGWQGAKVEVVHHPYLLSPDTPPEGVDMRASMSAKFGAERLEAMFKRVSEAGAAAGVKFDFEKMGVSPQTAPSHVLIEWAPEAKRVALIEAIHRAHFEEGKNIGDLEVLVSLAAASGLDAKAARAALGDGAREEAVRRLASQATRQGVRGVPHFVIGGRALNGAQDPRTLREAIAAAARTVSP